MSRRLSRRRLSRLLRRRALRFYYRLQRRAPIEPDLAVFAAYWYRGYACNPRAIYERLHELLPGTRAVWIVDRKHASSFPPSVPHVISGTRAYYRLLARAKYFVNNVNFPNEVVKRSGTIHVQTYHGTPLKTMGLDLRKAFVASRRMNFDRLLERASRWDFIVSSNPFSTAIWQRVTPGNYETLEVGYPRNDVLVTASESDATRIRDELGIDAGKRTILFAPTHREYREEYVPTADVGRLADELGEDFILLVRTHYFYADGSRKDAGDSRVLDVSDHPSVEELYLAADVLVTDYSSIMFDYAVLDRPIVIHAPDWEEYRRLRGTYFDLLAEPPGVVTTSDDEVVAAFRTGAVWSVEAERLRAAFREKFCSLEDGRAAERVVRRVWLGERTAPRSGPLAVPVEARGDE
jgi:CDP-glycerol glycerophosphotransferase